MKGSKNKFNRIKNKSNKSVCDLKYIAQWSFGSNMNAKKYVLDGDSKRKQKQYGNRYRLRDKTFGVKYQNIHEEDYKQKLKNTTILNQDFKKAMEKTKNIKSSVTFLDPPYYGQDKMYKERGVTPKEVCDTAKRMKGQVIITYNDVPEVRKHCSKGFKIRKISSRYTLGADSNNKKSKELLITNY